MQSKACATRFLQARLALLRGGPPHGPEHPCMNPLHAAEAERGVAHGMHAGRLVQPAIGGRGVSMVVVVRADLPVHSPSQSMARGPQE